MAMNIRFMAHCLLHRSTTVTYGKIFSISRMFKAKKKKVKTSIKRDRKDFDWAFAMFSPTQKKTTLYSLLAYTAKIILILKGFLEWMV